MGECNKQGVFKRRREQHEDDWPSHTAKPSDPHGFLKMNKKVVTPRQRTIKEKTEETDFQKLSSRSSTLALQESMAKFNEAQLKDVAEMGFQSLADLKLKDVPRRIAYWAIDSFDPIRCDLVLSNERRIHIESKDVWLVLGLPRGDRPIKRKSENKKCELLQEWISKFGKDGDKILYKDVRDMMLRETQGGTWFRIHFIILMTSCLIENAGNGYILPQIMENLGDMSKMHELDWCGYVIDSLIFSRQKWETNKSKQFTGPIVFLVALYVDRVVIYNKRTVARTFPTIKGWSYVLLKEREKSEVKDGLFGEGYQSDRYKPEEVLKVKEKLLGQEENHIIPPRNASTGEDDTVLYANMLLKCARQMAGMMVEAIRLIQEAPAEVLKHNHFKNIVYATEQLLGTAPISFDKPKYEDDWCTDTIMREIDVAVKKKNELMKMHVSEYPSFSIGLTQMDKGNGFDVNESRGVVQPCDENESNTIIDEVEDFVTPAPRKRITRNKMQLKRSNVYMSPFIVREINISDKIGRAEQVLCYWLMEWGNSDQEERVFLNDVTHLSRRVLRSLVPTMWINTDVIDVWCLMLNHNEHRRAPDSPFRFFATTYPCLSTVVHGPKDRTLRAKREECIRRLKLQISNTKGINIQSIDMFFFPIYHSSHFFLMCFDVKKSRINIFDNPATLPKETVLSKYGRVPCDVRKMFIEFLEGEGLNSKAAAMKNVEIIAPKLSWIDAKNYYDCGIYVMRHMETFMGDDVKKWRTGFKKNSGDQMAHIRLKYCAAILNAENNKLREENMKKANLFYKELVKEGPVDMLKKLLVDNLPPAIVPV